DAGAPARDARQPDGALPRPCPPANRQRLRRLGVRLPGRPVAPELRPAALQPAEAGADRARHDGRVHGLRPRRRRCRSPVAGRVRSRRTTARIPGARGRTRDLNWMQLAEYLERDDRVVLPLGSTEQHAYLSLETDNILAERVSVEAAEPLGVPVFPVLPYGLTAMFAAAYPGSPTLKLETYAAVLSELLDALYRPGFRRF